MGGHVVPLPGRHSRLLPAGPPRHRVPRSVPRPRAAGLAAAGTVGSWRETGAPSSSDLGVRGSWPTRVLRRWGTVPRVQAPVGEHVAARHEPERVAPPARPVVRRSSARTLAACPGSTPERPALRPAPPLPRRRGDRKSTRLNSSHANISYAVFCLKKKNNNISYHSFGPLLPSYSCLNP